MSAPPLLRTVQHALPQALQSLHHVPPLVNDFLMPATIDAAIYCDLQRVLRVYEPFRPWTVGAMDGAAARGLLDLLERLHDERDEGCSKAAFIAAASNGHVLVLEFLHDVYPALNSGAEELLAAARHGHLDVVTFLIRHIFVQRPDLEPAFVAAAVNGHVDVVEYLVGRVPNPDGAFIAAAENGHAPVLEVISSQRYHNYPEVREALPKALKGGHIEVVELLIRTGGLMSIHKAFAVAVLEMNPEFLRTVLDRCPPERTIIAKILEVAAAKDRCDMVEIILEKCTPIGSSYSKFDFLKKSADPTTGRIAYAISDAVDEGRLDMVKLLAKVSGSYLGDVLESAVRRRRWGVAELLLQLCDEQYLRKSDMKWCAAKMLEQAAATDNVEMARLLFSKCGDVEVLFALNIAVENGSVNIVALLAGKSKVSRVVDAFVTAAETGQVEMVNLLLTHIDEEAISEALEKAVSHRSVDVSKILLQHCGFATHKAVFLNAATSDSVGVLALLLDQMTPSSINRALVSAASRGHIEIVSALLDRSDSSAISCALEVAALEGNCDLVDLLRTRCDSTGIESAVEKALVVGCDEVVALLRSKKARLE